MAIIQNLHTHCTFCDGNNSIEEFVTEAKRIGLKSLGFSSHAFTGFEKDKAQMDIDALPAYIEKIHQASEKIGLPVFVGLEYESRSSSGTTPIKDSRLDYAIGSVHMYEKDGEVYINDGTIDQYEENLKIFGSPKALMENYYNEVVRFANYSDYDIVAHFDIITKFLEMANMSYTEEKWYKDLAIWAVDEVNKCNKIFEINTGGMARGFRKWVYPQRFIIEHIRKIDAPIILASDSHTVSTLVSYLDNTATLLKTMGFEKQMYLTSEGFKETAL